MKHPFFVTTTYQITTHTNPLTIALISDLHNRPCRKLLRRLAADKPDLIVIAGDLVVGRIPGAELTIKHPLANRYYSVIKSSPNSLLFLKKAVSIAPTYYVPGNHEWVLSPADYRLLSRIGIHLLDNAYEKLPIPDPVFIGGLTSAYVLKLRRYYKKHPHHIGCYPLLRKKQPIILAKKDWLRPFEEEDGFKILLCHHPEYWSLKSPYLATYDIDLILSGHAHGGQIRLFQQGLYTPWEGIFPKYTSGLHQYNHHRLIISRGLANTAWIPRINNPLELVYIKLLRGRHE